MPKKTQNRFIPRILGSLAILITLPKTNLTFNPESKSTQIEMFNNETNVEIHTPEYLKTLLNSSIPTIVTFTSKNCQMCMGVDYQLVILADNYAKRPQKKVNFAAICVEEHTHLIKELDIHAIPELRLYYRGMYQIYEYGHDFGIIDRWIEGHTHLADIHFIQSKKKFWKIVNKHQHALLWFGEDLRDRSPIFQDFMRCLFFRFAHHFFVLASENKNFGVEMKLKWNTLYEYNSFDDKFREVEINHLFQENQTELDMKKFHQIADFIESHSFRNVTLWNVDWMLTHPKTSSLIFYYKSLSNKHLNFEGMDQKEIGDMNVFNQTCEERIFGNIHCLIIDHESARVEIIDSIYHVEFKYLPETALVLMKYFRNRREIYLKKINENKILKREELVEFVNKVNNGDLEQYYTKKEKLPEDNNKREIKVVNSALMHEWLHDFSKDSIVLIHKGIEAKNSRSMIYKFEKAMGYIFDHMSSKEKKIFLSEVNLGVLDCEKNDCYYESDAGEFPSVSLFKPWRFSGTIGHSYKGFDTVGNIVTMVYHEYKGEAVVKEWFRDIEGFTVKEDKVRRIEKGNWVVDADVELEVDL